MTKNEKKRQRHKVNATKLTINMLNFKNKIETDATHLIATNDRNFIWIRR